MKKPIMTSTYNISLIGIQEYLVENTFKLVWENKIPSYHYNNEVFTQKEFTEISKKIHNVIYDLHPILKEIINYFKGMIQILNDINLPIIWITPAHMKITQKYIKVDKKIAGNFLMKNVKPVTVSLPTNNINKTKQIQSFMPNLIHSLDGAHIHLIVNNSNIENIYTIHDCFASD